MISHIADWAEVYNFVLSNNVAYISKAVLLDTAWISQAIKGDEGISAIENDFR